LKIVALNASMRKGGNTAQIISLIENRLRQRALLSGCELDYEYISLTDLNLSLCRGCRVCFDKGETKCPLKDGLPDLYKKLIDVDGVIFASPVYVEDVTAVMKNFIDRMAFNCHRPAFAGKTALIITTSGSGSSNHSVKTIKFAVGSWGFHIAGIKKFRMGALMDKNESAAKFDAETEMLSDRLFCAIAEKSPLNPSLFSLLVFKVQQKCYRLDEKFKDTYDRDYWEKKGWLDKSATYYIQHHISPLKTICARCLSTIVAKMFT
jgi:multimeric flavodoxin WrbA